MAVKDASNQPDGGQHRSDGGRSALPEDPKREVKAAVAADEISDPSAQPVLDSPSPTPVKNAASPPREMSFIRKLFKDLDKDQDGKIEPEELQTALYE